MIHIALKLIAGPTVNPVTLAEAKEHCRIDGTTEDTYIAGLILAATEYCETHQRRAFITQTWDLWLDDWPYKDHINIPRPPLQSVASVKHYDTENTEHTMLDTDYLVDVVSEPGRVVLGYSKLWPTETLRPANAVCVRFTAGYAPDVEDLAANVSQKIKQAILLLVSHWYEYREPVQGGNISKEIEFAVSALLGQDRIILV